QPYHLLLELARGKLNQVRGELSNWVMGGLRVTEPLEEQIHRATRAFAQAVVGASGGNGVAEAENALAEGYRAADVLAQTYVSQVFQLRHERQQALDTALGCRLAVAAPPESWVLEDTVNSVCVPFFWDQIEPQQGEYYWEAIDALVTWAQKRAVRLQ